MPAAFLYDDDAHVERLRRIDAAPAAPGARGLVGRQVASSEFFDAYLTFGTWDRVVAVVSNEQSRNTLAERFRSHPRVRGTPRMLQIIPKGRFHERFLATPPAPVFHLPQPMDIEYAWARHHNGRHGFALSGVTHTICTRAVMERLCGFVAGPFEVYDTLFCISRASMEVVRTVTDNYAAFLRERHGGSPRSRVTLEHVPLGVNPSRFRPPTPEERREVRQDLGVEDDEIVVLFVGRLNYHGKVHPFPMFRAVSEAARRTGRRVHLVLSGWAENDTVLEHFRTGAAKFAPGVRTTVVDGTDPRYRFRVWHAADLFTSLTDNIQETLSQTILEAQCSGLPVVVTDWDGCRDGMIPDETGFLVPARSVSGATRNGTSRYLLGETTYPEFLADTNQTIAVDTGAAAAAFARLISDRELRVRMGAAARDHVLASFTWDRVVRSYEEVWRRQEAVRRDVLAHATASPVRTPILFPDVEFSFASYPSQVLSGTDRVLSAPDAETRLDTTLSLPLTNYRPRARVVDRVVLLDLLRAAGAPCPIAALDVILARAGAGVESGRATIAWLLKCDFLTLVG